MENNIKEKIHKILVFWDPWNLINGSGAPENEYDSYIVPIMEVIKDGKNDPDKIFDGLNRIFSDPNMPQNDLEKSIKGMTVDIIGL